MTDQPLFAKSVPVTVVTGEYQSGKTVFALTTGYSLERTLVYDNELSAETYHSDENPFVRIDLPGELSRQYPKGYTSIQLYDAWLKHMRAIQPGQYDVIVIDTIETIEDGLCDWVEKNSALFGHSTAQYQKMSGIFWGDVKTEWKRIIQEMKSRCRMVILIVHMRDEYKNNVRTGNRQRRGKETLSELATLEVELVRKNTDQSAPSGKIHKHRFFSGSLADAGTIKPTLPRWMEVCTWTKIREYLVTPVEHDVAPPVEDTTKADEMEKLRLQAIIAEAEVVKIEHQATQAARVSQAPAQPAAATAPSGKEATPKVLFWRKLRDRIAEMGGDVTNPKAALATIDTTWAADALKLIDAERWTDALKLDMSAKPEATEATHS